MTYKHLRRNFSVLCIILTGSVLLVAFIISFVLSNFQTKQQFHARISYQSQVIEHQILGAYGISYTEIQKLEEDFQAYIFPCIDGSFVEVAHYDNNRELREVQSFIFQDDTLQTMPSFYIRDEFEVAGSDGTQYAGYFIAEPLSSQSWHSLVILFPSAYVYDTSKLLLLKYAVAFTGMLIVLFAVSWYLSGRALRPVEQAQKSQREFVTAASHELKSPLAIISASAEILEEESRLHKLPSAEICLHNIADEAKRMARLVDRLLLLSDSENGRSKIDRKSTDMENLLIVAFDRFNIYAEQNKHHLTLDLPEERLPFVNVDSECILHILSILLSNAIEHTPIDTPVELKARVVDGQVSISVIDYGPGIPDVEKEQIFQRFYQIDHSRTKKNNFGLGLSVAQQLAHLHETAITVSDTLDGGTTMTIRFSY